MPRFFVNDTEEFGKTAVIRGRDAEHIRVLRLRPGEAMTICDGRGTDYRCRLRQGRSRGRDTRGRAVSRRAECQGAHFLRPA